MQNYILYNILVMHIINNSYTILST